MTASDDKPVQNAWIKALLDDPLHNDNPLKSALAAMYRREQIAQTKLDLLIKTADPNGQLSLESLLADYEKQRRRLDKISRISDHYQENMRALNEDLKRHTAQAEKANHAKSNFLSRISHDLRSPLNGILGFTKLLQHKATQSGLDSKQLKYIDNILMAGNHLLQLINELLDLASIEAGKLHVEMGYVALNHFVADCFVIVTPLTRSKSITLINSINSDTPFYVHADGLRLKQVLINLLSNAIKYNSSQGSVQLYVTQPQPHRLRIHVEDTGCGMDEDKLAQLFQSFNRLGFENSSTEGCGIGLVIAKSLVELMGGTMGVFSQVGQGSTFWFELNTQESS